MNTLYDSGACPQPRWPALLRQGSATQSEWVMGGIEAMTRCPAEAPLRSVIEHVLPGVSEATVRLREKVLNVCADPGADAVLIRGPVGVGKSTVARLIAFGKRIALLRQGAAQRLVDDLGSRLEGPGLIHTHAMPWYVEFPVTGLVEALAESQLFGIGERAATGVGAKPGVFEIASTCRGLDDLGKKLTGGVVFLDEIGDLSPSLQVKLLPVLAGSVYYRVGLEGHQDSELRFTGVTLAASWKSLDASTLRPDLLSRIAGTTVVVPSTTERLADLPAIVGTIAQGAKDRLRERFAGIGATEPDLDRTYLDSLRKAPRSISSGEIRRLQAVDWSRHGELRGLAQVVRKVLVGDRDVEDALAELTDLSEQRAAERDHAAALLDELSLTTVSATLGGRVRDVELARRGALKRQVLSDPATAGRLARTLDSDPDTVRKQARQLDRRRRRATSAGSDEC
jgi:DNA-binding NtrC family response regulator